MCPSAPVPTGFADAPLPSLIASLQALLARCDDARCPQAEREALGVFTTAHLVEIAQRVIALVEADPALLPNDELRRFLVDSGFATDRPAAAASPARAGVRPRLGVPADARRIVVRIGR